MWYPALAFVLLQSHAYAQYPCYEDPGETKQITILRALAQQIEWARY